MPPMSAEAQRKIEDLIRRFKYTSDKKIDSWRIMELDKGGNYRGDCDDFSVTVWWFICDESYWKFWTGMLFFKCKFWFCKTVPEGDGHLVLEYKGMAIDNNYKKWMNREDMSYKFKMYIMTNLLLGPMKMLYGKLFG